MANRRWRALASATVFLALQCQPVAAWPSEKAETAFDRAEVDARLARVAYRLALFGAAECRERAPMTGLLFHHLAQYPVDEHDRLASEFRLDRGAGILAVAEGSSASRAGIRAGDVLVAVDGIPIPIIRAWDDGASPSETLMRRFYPLLEAALAKPEIDMTLLRGGRRFDTLVRPESGCALRPRRANAKSINAFADGGMVVVTDRLLQFVRDDDDMAVILSHELAHNILGHYAVLTGANPKTKRERRRLGESKLARDMETGADTLSVRLLAAAGYKLSAAPILWARLPGADTHRSKSHASLAERTRNWEAATSVPKVNPPHSN